MLEDRDYMREPDYGQQPWRSQFRLRWSWTMALIAANIVAFIVECVLCGYPPNLNRDKYFALSVDGIAHFQLWQFVTFQFMHASFLHIFFNCLTIFFFGRQLESELGPRKFLSLYFASGILGGVVQVVGGMFAPDHFGTAVVGASAGAMGLMTAFAFLYPEQKLVLLLYFFPVVTKAKYLVLGIATLSVLCILMPHSIFTRILGDNVSNAAHLGGMAMGLVYVKMILNRAMLGVGDEERYYQPQPQSVKPVAQKPSNEFEDGDVDAVLDKISARGINSLTPRERAILEAARKKMAQR